MLGLLNLSIKDFIVDTFGVGLWESILSKTSIASNWISSCPYEDKETTEWVKPKRNIFETSLLSRLHRSIVSIAASSIGISKEDLYVDYGEYFITKSVQGQSYAKLLLCVGSNYVEFLRNLNAFHLHLLLGFEDKHSKSSANGTRLKMIPPAFRCEAVYAFPLIENHQRPMNSLNRKVD